MMPTEPPEWVRDAVFYQVFPDRFARSETVNKPTFLDPWGADPTYHGFQGGDLIGVIERLDYLIDLGVSAIYFTPIFQSAANHRYHTHDYHRVDPMLGGDDALRRLLDEAHKRGVRVVLDGVFNHASRGFFPFHHALENGASSPYLDWFHIDSFPLNAYEEDKKPGYAAWWGLHALPKLNTDTPAVREFLWGVAHRWIDFGIDGWRLDVPEEINDDDFWREFRRRVKTVNPDAYIVGEVWRAAPRWLQGDMWDAVMNYPFTRSCIAFFLGDKVNREELVRTSLHPPGPTGAEAFRKAIEELQGLYSPSVTFSLLNLLGSHDTPRFLTLARGDLSAMRLATLFQMTYPGAPSIYYGDEIGLKGGHDPLNRGAFPWDESQWDHDLRRETQRLVQLRKERPALRRGTFEFVHAANEAVAYVRELNNEIVLVALNAGQGTCRLDLDLSRWRTAATELIFEGERGSLMVEDGHLRGLELAPRSGRVLATPRP